MIFAEEYLVTSQAMTIDVTSSQYSCVAEKSLVTSQKGTSDVTTTQSSCNYGQFDDCCRRITCHIRSIHL